MDYNTGGSWPQHSRFLDRLQSGAGLQHVSVPRESVFMAAGDHGSRGLILVVGMPGQPERSAAPDLPLRLSCPGCLAFSGWREGWGRDTGLHAVKLLWERVHGCEVWPARRVGKDSCPGVHRRVPHVPEQARQSTRPVLM